MIDDSDISTNLPSNVPPGSALNLQFFNTLIVGAHFSSMVAKQLTCMQALRQGPEYIVPVVAKLHVKLEALKLSHQSVLSFSTIGQSTQPPSGLTIKESLYLRYLFLNVTLAIHTTLTHPWVRRAAEQPSNSATQAQVEKSCRIVVETCRTAIRLISQLQFDVNTPVS